ncbi:inositol monophosphatase [Leptolyngbya sp. 15MV]|nr:inositol monophosphatase [Leptolyngbya sp. 15MV]
MAALSGLIRVMERAARKAGGRLRRDFGEVEHLQVSRKGPADFVSKADMRAERTLYDELLAARPDWGFVMEEAGVIEGDPGKPRWIVDPLDGTSNFLHGIPHFAVSIAAQEPKLDGSGWGDVVAGVIYQPITDETFWAEKTRGAWLQDGRLRVSARSRLPDALIATGIPFHRHGDFEQWTRIFAKLGPEVAGTRRFGAASLDQEQRLGNVLLGVVKGADNGDLVVQGVDNLAGSSDLINIRARGRFARPFEKVREIQSQAEQQWQAKQQELQERLRETEAKIAELQRQRPDAGGAALMLTPEQQAEIRRFGQTAIETRRELRNVQFQLNKDVEALESRLKLLNIGAMPLLVGVFALGLGAFRASRRRGVRRAQGDRT